MNAIKDNTYVFTYTYIVHNTKRFVHILTLIYINHIIFLLEKKGKSFSKLWTVSDRFNDLAPFTILYEVWGSIPKLNKYI